jgi:hypothetical protein
LATDRMPIDSASQILLGMTTCLLEAIISLSLQTMSDQGFGKGECGG